VWLSRHHNKIGVSHHVPPILSLGLLNQTPPSSSPAQGAIPPEDMPFNPSGSQTVSPYSFIPFLQTPLERTRGRLSSNTTSGSLSPISFQQVASFRDEGRSRFPTCVLFHSNQAVSRSSCFSSEVTSNLCTFFLQFSVGTYGSPLELLRIGPHECPFFL